LRIKGTRSSKICFYYKPSLLKGSFVEKELDMELKAIFDLFFEGYFSSSFKGLLTSSVIFLKY